ncbi:hypothetical protein FDI26_gp47 [Arthrobacter phage Beans]|uniref:Uncharacterized protein n=1 Tax=Arthrobacter phage Beans TaxID=2015815 RepID=A0A222ZKA0_9CAUD|nr:hypothetical protein FDI26_gp47 [Arthrobacter phage Beans]ASR84722.1 hypothetical protein SEA_BEANS_47 [Arthrobacter phage Beans]
MTFASDKMVTARKVHKCGECAGVIVPGERYARWAGSYEGDFWHMKSCASCDAFRKIILYVDEYFWEGCYGGIHAWVGDRLDREISTSYSWTFRLHIARLSSLFRQRWAGKGDAVQHALAAMQLEQQRFKTVAAG